MASRVKDIFGVRSYLRRKRAQRRYLRNLRKLEELKRLQEWAYLRNLRKLQELKRLQEWASTTEGGAFSLINFWRQALGLAPLAWDEALYRGAKEHSRRMFIRGELFHEVLPVVPPGVLPDFPDGFPGFAECCYGGRGNLHLKACTAEGTVRSWLSSKAGHREILLGRRFQKGAIGVYTERGKGFFATFRCW